MKKKLISLMMLMSAMSMNAAVGVDRIEPTNWYVGMKDASLQLMVHGKDVRSADVEVSTRGCASILSHVSTRPTISSSTSTSKGPRRAR